MSVPVPSRYVPVRTVHAPSIFHRRSTKLTAEIQILTVTQCRLHTIDSRLLYVTTRLSDSDPTLLPTNLKVPLAPSRRPHFQVAADQPTRGASFQYPIPPSALPIYSR